ncbi:hypothetical protein OIV83_004243 [Microbotryomycetes sp. JL201]|nr:hypothetical protein OIV83_004243 [Microbotryomycetes sp. JL201]
MAIGRRGWTRTALCCVLGVVVLASWHALLHENSSVHMRGWLLQASDNRWSRFRAGGSAVVPGEDLQAVIRKGTGNVYSSVDCHGTEGTANPLETKCRFRNVCLELLDLPEHRAMLDADVKNNPEYVRLSYYRPDWLAEAPLYWFKGYAKDGPWSRVDWAGTLKPTLVSGTVPPDSLWSPAETTILTEAWWPENFGHALGDDYLPVYRLAQYFDRFDSARLSVIFHPSCQDRGSPGEERDRGCSHHLEISNLLLDTPIIDANSSALFRKKGPVCFKELLVGTGGVRMGFPAEGHVWSDFASTIKKRSGIDPSYLPGKQRITIMYKARKRTFTNYDELVQSLRDRFNVEVELLDPNELSLTDQLAVLSRTTVLVSPCGGISFSAAFLPPGASAVFSDYWDTRANRSFSMEKYIFTQMSDLTSFYYTVDKKDVSVDIENVWSGDRDNEWIVYRNYADVTIDLERMELYVLAEVAFEFSASFQRD